MAHGQPDHRRAHKQGKLPDENNVIGKERGQGQMGGKQTESTVEMVKVKAV